MSDPLSLSKEFEQVHERMEQMWRRITGVTTTRPQYHVPVYEPPTDIYETADAFIICMEIAGVAGQEIEVRAEHERITIRGNRLDRRNELPERRRVLQLEVCFGLFERTVHLPAGVDVSQATVNYTDGFLEIRLPKLAPRQHYHVRIVVR